MKEACFCLNVIQHYDLCASRYHASWPWGSSCKSLEHVRVVQEGGGRPRNWSSVIEPERRSDMLTSHGCIPAIQIADDISLSPLLPSSLQIQSVCHEMSLPKENSYANVQAQLSRAENLGLNFSSHGGLRKTRATTVKAFKWPSIKEPLSPRYKWRSASETNFVSWE